LSPSLFSPSRISVMAQTPYKQLEQEWKEVRESLIRRLAGTVTEAAGRALADLSDTTVEDAMTRAFQRRLLKLPDADRNAIAAGAALRGDIGAFIASASWPVRRSRCRSGRSRP